MIFNTTNFPNSFFSRRGIPVLTHVSIEVTDDNVVIGVPNRTFRGWANSGIFAFVLTQEVPASGAALPVAFDSNSFLKPLTVLGGNATGAQITPVGTYLVWYDKYTNTLQLLTPASTT